MITIYEEKDFNVKELINSLKDELKCDEQGNSFASIRGTARLVDVDYGGLARAFRTSVDKIDSKMLEMLIEYGFTPVDFSVNGVPDTAVSIVIKYYAYFAGKRCTVQAKLLDLALSATSLRLLVQETLNWKSKEEIQRVTNEKADKVMLLVREINQLQPFTAQILGQAVVKELKLDVKTVLTTEDDLNSSLVANRLGLAFNKHLKAFDTLKDATSPEAFVNLKEQYLALAEEHAELLKVKTAKPVVERVEVPVEKIVEVPVEGVSNKEDLAKIRRLRNHIKDIENKMSFLECQMERLTGKKIGEMYSIDTFILPCPE